MAIFLNEDSKVIVQGMTGSEGSKHTQRMLASGTTIVGGVNPKKAGQTVEFDGGVTVPVFGSVAEAIDGDRRERVGHLRAAGLRQGRRRRGDRRPDPAGRGHHRGRRRCKDTAEFYAYAVQQGTTRIIGPNCPGLISPGSPTPASSRPTSPAPAASAWSPSRAR